MTRGAFVNISRIAMIVIVSISVVVAQGTPKLNIQITDSKVNLSSAEKMDGSTVSYGPGDTLRYSIVASNIGDGLMTSTEVVDPIPDGVTYVAESALGEDAEISFSINQGSTYMSWPPYYTVRNSKGILVKRKASPDMVSHIKWALTRDLKPEEASALEFMVVVSK
ncbi:MAG: hypothetical protein U9Q77_00750 [Candidatus Marinimicrobia bacterium]|nr:hypothetical protein [Candidatus Neomarinimicrobiota bacterium]